MPRNLDRRVEILFPIAADDLKLRIRREVLEPFDLDDCGVYEMDSDGRYHRRTPQPGAPGTHGQLQAESRVAAFARHARRASIPQPLAAVIDGDVPASHR